MLESGERYTVEDVIGDQAIITSHSDPSRTFLMPVAALPTHGVGVSFIYDHAAGSTAALEDAARILTACITMLQTSRGLSNEQVRALLRELSVGKLSDADYC